jgi:hypothetical protein
LELTRSRRVDYRRLKHSHYFGDYQLHLYIPKIKTYIFSMDYSSTDSKVYGNNVGTGDERFHSVESERIQAVLAAIQDCLDYKLKYGTPTFESIHEMDGLGRPKSTGFGICSWSYFELGLYVQKPGTFFRLYDR